mmetsp:Transcript_8189/g.16331  ORF Transcript_8189/g.16331 Transcript_8189/m.16331 type:complete len:319 (+) Transcript_8189:515-1471(+)
MFEREVDLLTTEFVLVALLTHLKLALVWLTTATGSGSVALAACTVLGVTVVESILTELSNFFGAVVDVLQRSITAGLLDGSVDALVGVNDGARDLAKAPIKVLGNLLELGALLQGLVSVLDGKLHTMMHAQELLPLCLVLLGGLSKRLTEVSLAPSLELVKPPHMLELLGGYIEFALFFSFGGYVILNEVLVGEFCCCCRRLMFALSLRGKRCGRDAIRMRCVFVLLNYTLGLRRAAITAHHAGIVAHISEVSIFGFVRLFSHLAVENILLAGVVAGRLLLLPVFIIASIRVVLGLRRALFRQHLRWCVCNLLHSLLA